MIVKKTAKELLVESFHDVAGRKAANKITVREITENCGYSPATFYREFRDKYDLIAWSYAQDVTKIMQQVGSSGFPWNKTLLEGALYFWQHRDYYCNLLSHTSGQISFENCMIEANSRSLDECVRKLSGSCELDYDTKAFIRLYCLGTVRLACEWITGAFSADPAGMADIWERSLPGPLQSFLYTNG